MTEEKKIVIADDSATARMIIMKCFEIAGFENVKYLEAENGRDALRLVKKNKVFLLVTDFNMPVMDGGVLLKWVKGSPSIREVPVIVITSAGNPAREKEFKDLGAFTVIAKPVSPAVIADKLQCFIED